MLIHPDGHVRQSGRILLCWSDEKSSSPREEFVEMIDATTSEALLRSRFELAEKTKVRLLGEQYKNYGTVRSCKKAGEMYMVTVRVHEESEADVKIPSFDPGVLAVEHFLTEEEEAQLLADVIDKDPSPVKLASTVRSNWLHICLTHTMRGYQSAANWINLCKSRCLGPLSTAGTREFTSSSYFRF